MDTKPDLNPSPFSTHFLFSVLFPVLVPCFSNIGNSHPRCLLCMLWFNFILGTEYHTLPYPKTKTKKRTELHQGLNWTTTSTYANSTGLTLSQIIINSSSISIFIIFSKLESFHWYQFTEKIRWSTPSIGTPTIRLRRFSFYITWQIKWPPSPRAFSVRSFLTSTKDNRRELSLARSLSDFARTTDQERTPRD